jgi:hypothetical protein
MARSARISVEGPAAGASLADLTAWLADDVQLGPGRALVLQEALPPGDGERHASLVVRLADESGGPSLARALVAWLQVRTRDVDLRVRTEYGELGIAARNAGRPDELLGAMDEILLGRDPDAQAP